MTLVPLVSLITVLDLLWPLWDQKRQALHDKVAKTAVVEGSQPSKTDSAQFGQSGNWPQR